MEIGVFIPIGNNGWLISTTSPQYTPSFDLNREVVLRAERYGFDFALSMIKLHGFGGPSRFWDDNLESFTLMAALASVTERIKLYASVATLTMPPAFQPRRRRQQSARVGMRRRGEYGPGRARLDDAAEIHDRHAVGEPLDDGQVVGNEQIGEGKSFPQIQE